MLNDVQPVLVGGLPITPFNGVEAAVDTLFDGDKIIPGFAIAVNAEKVVASGRDEKFKRLLLNASLLYADGISVVHSIRSKGIRNKRVPGCELWEAIMKRAAYCGIKVFLLGATEDTNAATACKLRRVYDLENLVRCNGFFQDESKVMEEIIATKPDIVTVAMGTPKQERLITRLIKCHPNALYMGVGGSYDVFIGAVKRAPSIYRTCNLEWLYRLLIEPKRLFRQVSLLKFLYLQFSGKL